MAMFTKKRKFAKTDFSYQNLPQTRRAQFRDLVKHRFNLILKIGFVLTLFALPLIFTIYFKKIYETGFYQMFSDGEITQAEYSNSILILTLIGNILYLVDFMILSIGLSGIGRILKQLSWSEPVYFWYDFKLGIRQNIKNYLFDSFVLGLLFSICSVVLVYFGFLSIFGVAMVLLVFLVPLPAFIVKLAYVPIYNTGIWCSFKNSLLVCFSMKFKILLCTLIFVLPCFIFLFPYALLSLIIFIFILLLFYPLILLGYNLYIYNIFDSLINNIHYKEIYRKGLYNGIAEDNK